MPPHPPKSTLLPFGSAKAAVPNTMPRPALHNSWRMVLAKASQGSLHHASLGFALLVISWRCTCSFRVKWEILLSHCQAHTLNSCGILHLSFATLAIQCFCLSSSIPAYPSDFLISALSHYLLEPLWKHGTHGVIGPLAQGHTPVLSFSPPAGHPAAPQPCGSLARRCEWTEFMAVQAPASDTAQT